ncbi:MAG: hypothetical protein RLO50_06610 [Azospirillaceae bacterium]
MHPIRRLTLAAVAIAAMPLAPAGVWAQQADDEHERLVVAIPFGWAPAGSNDSETAYGTLYASPGDASEAIAVQQLLGASDMDPGTILTRFAETSGGSCAQSTITDPTRGEVGGQPSIAVRLTCLHEGGAAEVTNLTLVEGEADMHVVTQIWTGSAEAVENAERDARWQAFAEAIDYCADAACR